ncbi:MAG: diguanylate cyclase [Candidatus Cloacimonadota bacterium]|nr:diguanylate cyclase [Candidatus Cloacimonadota bacterium]
MKNKLKVSVLYVEDELLIRQTISEMLEKDVDELHVASDGQMGLEKFKELKPDIVITDIKMPKMDGFTMLQKIREISPNVKTVIISVYGDSKKVLDAINRGINGFLIKPIFKTQLSNLLNSLDRQIEKQREEQRKKKRMFDLARIDPLTKFLNQQGMIDRLTHETTIFDRSLYENNPRPFAILLCEIHNFRKIGKEHGLTAVDEVIISVCKIIWSMIRRQDVISRWSPSEIMLLLTNTDKKGATFLGQKIIQRISLQKIKFKNKTIDINPLFGIGEYYTKLSVDNLVQNTFNDLQERMYSVPKIDPLTKFLNKSGMLDRLNHEKKKVEKKSDKENEYAFTILFCQITNYTNIESHQGLKGVNSMILSLAKEIWLMIRRQDTIARWSKNEIMLLLPETDEMGGGILSEKILNKIKTINLKFNNELLNIRLRFGVKEYSSTLTIEELVKIVIENMQNWRIS